MYNPAHKLPSFVHITPAGERIAIEARTVIHGTHRWQDLLETLVPFCKFLGVGTPDVWEDELKMPAPSDDWREDVDEDAEYILNEEVFPALDAICHRFWHFGCTEGDGSDYGFWFSDPNEDIDEEIQKAAKEAANNHAKNTDWYWSFDARPYDAENYTIRTIESRGCDLLAVSNAAFIRKQFPDGVDDVSHQRFAHWFCGWTETLVFPVYDEDGRVTEVFQRFYAEVIAPFEEYPVLDEDGYCTLRDEDTWSTVTDAVADYFDGTSPLTEDQVQDVASHVICNNDDSDSFGSDDGGNAPDEEMITAALVALGLPHNTDAHWVYTLETPTQYSTLVYLCDPCRALVNVLGINELAKNEVSPPVTCDFCEQSLTLADLGGSVAAPTTAMQGL